MAVLRSEMREGVLWIHLAGELNHTGCAEIAEELQRAATRGRESIVLDLGGVDLLASQGISLILRVNKLVRDKGRELWLAGLRPRLRRTLDTVGVFRVVREWPQAEPPVAGGP